MSNGLDDLSARRGNRKRRTPPAPAHPRSTQPEQPVEPAPTPPPAPSRKRSDARRGARTPSVEVYLDSELRAWLDDVEDAGFAQRERAVISPVMRLALRRLAETMTPTEAVTEAMTPQNR